MIHLQDLLRLIPNGTWSSDCNVLIDPKGRRLSVTGVTPDAPGSLYADLFASSLNQLPVLLLQLSSQTQRLSDALKEVDHCRHRVRASYDRALTDVVEVIVAQQVRTVSSQQVLEALLPQIERLRNDPTETAATSAQHS